MNYWVIGIIVCLLSPYSYAENGPVPGQESRGGDVFEIGGDGKLQFFDKFEHGTKFVPAKLKEYKETILPQLVILKKKLPRTARLLEETLSGPRPRWYYIKVTKLKDIVATDNSALQITFKKRQAAVNLGYEILVDENIWDSLKDGEDRAWLLMHETLWSTVGTMNDRKLLSSLSALLMDKDLAKVSKKHIAEEIQELVRDKNSPLYKTAQADISVSGTKVEGWEDVTHLNDGVTPTACLHDKDNCAFKDKATELVWTQSSPEDSSVGELKDFLDASDNCTKLKGWAGYEDGWRLPSFTEYSHAAPRLRPLSKSVASFGANDLYFWTSTPKGSDENKLWSVNVATDQRIAVALKANLTWRCVHSPKYLSKWEDRSASAKGTIKKCELSSDNCVFKDGLAGGLAWSSVDPTDAGEVTQSAASVACAGLTWAGKAGWRLPTIHEYNLAKSRGIYILSLQYPKFKEAVGSFWTGTLHSAGKYSSFYFIYPLSYPGGEIDTTNRFVIQSLATISSAKSKWMCVNDSF